MPKASDSKIARILGYKPEEVKRTRAEIKAKGEIKPTEGKCHRGNHTEKPKDLNCFEGLIAAV